MSPRVGYRHSDETRKKMCTAQSSRAVRVARSVTIQQAHPERFPPDHTAVLQASRNEDSKRIAWARTIWQKYGLTVEDEARLYEAQHGLCPLCRRRFVVNQRRNGSGMDYGHWRIDHDHVSGITRGLLCHVCNWHLGFFSDINAIATYLQGGACFLH